MPKYFIVARKVLLFFALSHLLSYIVSNVQTKWIINEIRKIANR